MTEEWRAVVGFEGSYEVSDLGRVRSVDRYVTYRKDSGRKRYVTKFYRGRVLRPGTVKSGHQLVVLGAGNSKFCKFVHDLVLRAFVGPPSDGQESLHWNDQPDDNPLKNLRWGTRAENLADFERNYGHRQNDQKQDCDHA